MEFNNEMLLRAPRLRNRIMQVDTHNINMIFNEDSSDESDNYNEIVSFLYIYI